MHIKEQLPQLLQQLGIEKLNPMQEEALMMMPKEPETLLLAPTGSGKTIAFLFSVLQLIDKNKQGIQCLILCPSRELVIQIEQVWKKMSTGFKVNSCYGGHSLAVEKQNLSVPPTLLIGTPGRIADHLHRKTIDVSATSIIVYDEFDKSLALGFHEQMNYIMNYLPALQNKILVSATSKIEIPDFINLVHPVMLDFIDKVEDDARLKIYQVHSEAKDKIACLDALLCNLGANPTIVFCNHREAVERTSKMLSERGIDNAFFHGGMDQIDREKTLIQFRNGSVHFLIASDLAARGLDISSVKNIIHYHLPTKSEEFIHRNGRTARMHASGDAYIILSKDEELPRYIDDVPEEYIIQANKDTPPPSVWSTLYISGGKKDKLSKGDILGYLTKAVGIHKDEIGMIELLDFMSFVGIKKATIKNYLPKMKQEKIKGRAYKVELVSNRI
jgi:superfamily II DNA/RNA helicase